MSTLSSIGSFLGAKYNDYDNRIKRLEYSSLVDIDASAPYVLYYYGGDIRLVIYISTTHYTGYSKVMLLYYGQDLRSGFALEEGQSNIPNARMFERSGSGSGVSAARAGQYIAILLQDSNDNIIDIIHLQPFTQG